MNESLKEWTKVFLGTFWFFSAYCLKIFPTYFFVHSFICIFHREFSRGLFQNCFAYSSLKNPCSFFQIFLWVLAEISDRITSDNPSQVLPGYFWCILQDFFKEFLWRLFLRFVHRFYLKLYQTFLFVSYFLRIF